MSREDCLSCVSGSTMSSATTETFRLQYSHQSSDFSPKAETKTLNDSRMKLRDVAMDSTMDCAPVGVTILQCTRKDDESEVSNMTDMTSVLEPPALLEPEASIYSLPLRQPADPVLRRSSPTPSSSTQPIHIHLLDRIVNELSRLSGLTLRDCFHPIPENDKETSSDTSQDTDSASTLETLEQTSNDWVFFEASFGSGSQPLAGSANTTRDEAVEGCSQDYDSRNGTRKSLIETPGASKITIIEKHNHDSIENDPWPRNEEQDLAEVQVVDDNFEFEQKAWQWVKGIHSQDLSKGAFASRLRKQRVQTRLIRHG